MPKFEYYVLNYDINRRKVVPYNIFNNHYVNEETLNLAMSYASCEISYEELRDGLDKAIKYQEWSRAQYEIVAGDIVETDIRKLQKFDAYFQAHMNIDLITKMVIDKMFEEIYQERLY